MKLFDDCPGNAHCGPSCRRHAFRMVRPGIDVRLCVRCGKELPDLGDVGCADSPARHWPEEHPAGFAR